MYREEEARPARTLLALATMALLMFLTIPAVTSAQGELQITGGASSIPTKALDCDADITLAYSPMAPGTMFTGTITVTNVLTTDAVDAEQNQYYNGVTYFPDCVTTGPCTPNLLDVSPPTVGVYFNAASVGGSCMGLAAMTTTELVDRIEFNFPAELTLAPPLPSSCTITFDIAIPPAMLTFDSEVVATADCRDTGLVLNSTTTATAQIMGVPVLGDVALIVLALLLAGSAWLYLRRREIPAATA